MISGTQRLQRQTDQLYVFCILKHIVSVRYFTKDVWKAIGLNSYDHPLVATYV